MTAVVRDIFWRINTLSGRELSEVKNVSREYKWKSLFVDVDCAGEY